MEKVPENKTISDFKGYEEFYRVTFYMGLALLFSFFFIMYDSIKTHKPVNHGEDALYLYILFPCAISFILSFFIRKKFHRFLYATYLMGFGIVAEDAKRISDDEYDAGEQGKKLLELYLEHKKDSQFEIALLNKMIKKKKFDVDTFDFMVKKVVQKKIFGE